MCRIRSSCRRYVPPPPPKPRKKPSKIGFPTRKRSNRGKKNAVQQPPNPPAIELSGGEMAHSQDDLVNALHPKMTINHLPNEVISEIFRMFALSSLHSRSLDVQQIRVVQTPIALYAALHTLVQVCQKWHALVFRDPTLWAYISNFKASPPPERILELCRKAPLDVEYMDLPSWSHPNLLVETDYAVLPPVLALTVPSIVRWRRADIIYSNPKVIELLINAIPSDIALPLQELSFRRHPYYGYGAGLVNPETPNHMTTWLSQKSLPYLKKLTLHLGIEFVTPKLLLNVINTLIGLKDVIEEVELDLGMNADHTALLMLEMSREGLLNSEEPPKFFTKLKSFTITHADTAFVQWCLLNISAPMITKLKIHGLNSFEMPVIQSVSPFPPLLASTFQRMDAANFHAQRIYMHIKSALPNDPPAVELAFASRQAFLAATKEIFKLPHTSLPLTRLTTITMWDTETNDTMLEVFRNSVTLRKIVHLEVTGASLERTDQVLRVLLPREKENTTSRFKWALPSLETVRLENCRVDTNTIAEVVAARDPNAAQRRRSTRGQRTATPAISPKKCINMKLKPVRED